MAEKEAKLGPLGIIPTKSQQHKHKIGYTRSLTFNSKSRTLWPSDLKFWILTVLAILIPSTLCIYITIWGCKNFDDLDLTARYFVTILYLISLFVVLWALLMVTFTEPGIMPSVFMNTRIQNTEIKKVNVYKDYYVEYKNRQELIDSMEKLSINNPVDKYYSLNKFKYLPGLTV